MPIRRLPEHLVSQIAAGEVIERPAAVVKELVENALDAAASEIHVRIDGGGQTAIVVTDDGDGMTPDDLVLALERHATSKLPSGDLAHIETLGFRGEALPSIASVSRFRVASRARGASEAWAVEADAGKLTAPVPDPQPAGTRVEVRDLFHPVPARAKFLKQPRTERGRAADAVRQLAMAHVGVSFTLKDGERTILQLPATTGDAREQRRERLGRILGRDFAANALEIDAEHENFHLTGFAAVPTFNKPSAQSQYLFVNGRPVRDRLLLGATRAAYQDLLPRDRHPVVALFLGVVPEDVDVNVHPTKAEVRFRDFGRVRSLIVSALRHSLAEAGHRASTTVSTGALGAARPGGLPSGGGGQGAFTNAARFPASGSPGLAPNGLGEVPAATHDFGVPVARMQGEAKAVPDSDAHPLGAARAQIHETYVVAETADGLIIVDQHAAHERLVFERIKAGVANSGIARQIMLIPEVVEVPGDGATALAARAGELFELGLAIEPFGEGAVIVREVPAMLHGLDVQGLLRDLADDLSEFDEAASLKDRLGEVCATMACHSSIRAGRILNGDEMNALLREMEVTPHAGQCSHGRPTYVELKLTDIERLFGRR